MINKAETVMSEWKECKLGEIINSNAASLTTNYPYTKIFYLDTGSITAGRVNAYQEIELSQAPSRAKRLVKDGDIVYSTVRPIQRHYGFIRKPLDNLVVSTGFSVIETKKNIADPLFIYNLLASDEIVELLDTIAEGSTSAYPSLKPSDIESLDILLPPLPEQRVIAAVLSSLDDKIDLLQRQNNTLEVITEILFRKCFVVEANEKWEGKSLLEFIDLIGGGTPKTDVAEYWDGNIPWLSGGDIAAHHKAFIKTTEKSITESGITNSSAKVLPKFSTVISARGTVGKYCLLAEPMAFSQSNYGILPRTKDTFFFTYLLLSHLVEELQSSAYGSVFDTITTSTFRDIKVCMPEDSVIKDFEIFIKPYFNKILHNENQISSLKDLRETLLPKLMSGEVRVEV